MADAEDRQPAKRRLDFLSRIPMGPRKKSKPDVEAPALGRPAEDPPVSESTTANSSTTLQPDPPVEAPPQNTDQDAQSSSQPTPKKSWYGSWNSKAAPVAQLSTNNAGISSSTPNLRAHASKPALPSMPTRYMSGSMKRGEKANPLAASLSNVTATPSPKSASRSSVPLDSNTQPSIPAESKEVKQAEDPPLPPQPVIVPKESEEVTTKDDARPSTPGGWRGWWSKPDKPETKAKQKSELETAKSEEEARNTPLPGTTPSEELPEQTKGVALPDGSRDAPNGAIESDAQVTDEKNKDQNPATQAKSWFWLWSHTQNHRDDVPTLDPAKSPEEQTEVANEPRAEETPKTIPPRIDIPQPTPIEPENAPKKEPSSKPSGWAFWSRENSQSDAASDAGSTHKQVGELAVSGTPSQAKPEEAQFNEREESVKTELPKKNDSSSRAIAKRKDTLSAPTKSTPSASPTRKTAEVPGKATETAQIVPPTQTQPTSEPERKNLLFPEFHATYKLAQQPTYWQQIRRYFLGSAASAPHLSIASNPVRIKKALAIGVHGYFPAPLIQKVLGQPTGTSIRFANAAAAAIKKWTEERGYEAEIEKVALEGEGFVADRVDTLWKLLLNWIDHIRSADFILVACHSQGVPVAIMLVSKLIQFGCVNPNVRVGICAMAGVNLGPFPEYRSRLIGGMALELFDFGRPESKVSQMYQDSLNVVLGRGVKIVYIGCIDDQLVSLESSTFSNISHPLIYRAVFIDIRTHAPNFLTHLVGFVFKLRNLGIPDHGLIRELSPALAGSLYTGEGHSQIYRDAAVYDLAVRHALETTDFTTAEIGKGAGKMNANGILVKWDEAPAGAADRNPYFLPWAMRGVLEEDMVRRELGDECRVLLQEFEEWKPTNKVLKDVKFRLEAVKSKL